MSEQSQSEGAVDSEGVPQNPAPVSSPAATGGAGNVFEQAVGAYWLTQLLVGATPPIFIDCTVTEVQFQTEYLGWHTDDFLVIAQNSCGATRKLAGQVKRTFTISSIDEDCKSTILDFWKDFNDPGVFARATDRFALVTQLGTNALLRHFGNLLDCARAARDEADFELRLNTAGFLSSTSVRYCDELVAIISAAEGRDTSRREIFPLLQVLHVLSLDLSSSTRQAEAAMKSLLSYTARADDKAEAANRTWDQLLSLAAEAAPGAKAFTKLNLPQALKERHDTCGLEHPMLTALHEHTGIITGGIRSSIGANSHLPRAGLVQQVLADLEQSRVVLLSGPAGTGKSVIAKDVFGFLSRDHFAFAFRAEEFAQPHFDATLTLGNIPGRAATLSAVLAGQVRKIVLIESVERLLEKSTRDAFADLLTIVARDQSFRLILTCRDYSADLVRTAFLRDTAVDHAVVEVPQLTDVELEEIQTANPSLALPLSSPALRKILRNPYILDKALLIRWSPDVPLPTSERDFRNLFWREIVRADHRPGGGIPARRDAVFCEIALRRARALSMYASSDGLDAAAIEALYADSLVVRSERSTMLIAPAHDVLEDWAILRWIEERHTHFGENLKEFSTILGVHPALRRAYRKWLAELLECNPPAADAFFRGAIYESGIPASFKDDTLVALLRDASASALIENHRSDLLTGDKELLKRLIHLVRVACVATPPWLQGKAAIFNVPYGPAWAALLQLIQSGWTEYRPEDALLVLGLLEDWAKSVSPQLPYPDGAPAAAAIAHVLLSKFDDYSHDDERKRTLHVIAKIPNADRQRFVRLLSAPGRSRRERSRAAEELQNIVFAGPGYESLPTARDMAKVLTEALRKQLLCTDDDLDAELRWSSSLDIEIYFGIRERLRHDYFPPSAYRTPILMLLRQHPRVALDFIIEVFNHVADWYAHPRVQDRLEPAFEIELKLPSGDVKKHWCNGRLWNMYRGTSVGPYVLQSYLMGLERWLYEIAKQAPDQLDAILLELLARSDNGATAAVVASIATAYPFQCGESLLTLLSAKDYVMMDRHRLVAESHVTAEIFGNLLGSRSAENRIYQTERAEADKWPHRRQDLESSITNLQFTKYRDQVQSALDQHRNALGDVSTQDDGDRLWRLAIHRMDLREYAVADDPSMPEELREKGYIRLEAKDPEPDLKEMVDRNAPIYARTQSQMGLMMWAYRVFKREIEPSHPDESRVKLAAAMSFEEASPGDPMADIVSGAPALVAAVCVRDCWRDLSDAEREWCIERVCSAVLASADNWDRLAGAQRFDMSPDRSCAWSLSALVAKDLSPRLRARVEEAFIAALTHPVEEVSWYATWGAAELWPENRELTCRCVYAIAMEASMIASATEAEKGTPYERRRRYEDIKQETANYVRQLFWQPGAIGEHEYDRLVIDEWHGAEAQNRILAIVGKAPTELLAAKAFARASQALVQWWSAKNDRTGRRERNYEAELNTARLIEQFVMRAPIEVAKTVLIPILEAMDTHTDEVHNVIEGLLLVEDREPNTQQFWALWLLFADRARQASWLKRIDDRYAGGGEVIRSLFLGTMWKEEVRHWRSLEGNAHHLHALFEQLPPSAAVFDSYAYFLYHVGEQSLPDAFIRISKRLQAGDPKQLLRNANTIFRLEVILQRYVYPKPQLVKTNAVLRDSVLDLLDLLVELGSSAAFKMRDDFVTPVSA